MVLVLVLATTFLLGCGIDLYVPSLPVITSYFSVTSSLVQASVGAYLLGYAGGQLVLGVLSDSLGRRKIVVLSGAFFTIFSIAAALSPNIYFFNSCRLLQGIAIGGLGAAIRAAITDLFAGKDLVRIIPLMTTFWSLGPILGPFIGGYLQHYLNWQADFYFFGLCGFAITCGAYFGLPESHHRRMPLNLGKIIKSILTIFVHPVFLTFSTIAALTYSVVVIFNVVGPYLVESVLQYTVIDYGRIALFLGCGHFLGNVVNRFLVSYIEGKKIVLVSLLACLVIVSLLIILGLTLPLNLWIILAPIGLLFFTTGCIMPNLYIQVVKIFPQTGGMTTAIYGTISAGGVSIVSSVMGNFRVTSQMPLAWVYLGVFLSCLTLFFCGMKIKKSQDR